MIEQTKKKIYIYNFFLLNNSPIDNSFHRECWMDKIHIEYRTDEKLLLFTHHTHQYTFIRHKRLNKRGAWLPMVACVLGNMCIASYSTLATLPVESRRSARQEEFGKGSERRGGSYIAAGRDSL